MFNYDTEEACDTEVELGYLGYPMALQEDVHR